MGALALIILAWTLGGVCLRGLSTRGAERAALRLFAGLSLCAIVAITVGSASIFALRVVFGAGAVAAIAWGIWRRYGRPDDGGEPEHVDEPGFNRFEAVCLGVVIAANTLTFLSALAPVTSWDAGTAHLAVPSDYARMGRIGLLEGNVYSAYPQLLHALFAYVYAESGERATTLTSWVLSVAVCAALYALGKRVAGAGCGVIAAAMFSTAPIYFAQSGTVAIDLAFTGWIAGALVAVVAWKETGSTRFILLAGLLAGSAYGIRHTGYLVAALLLVGVAFWSMSKDLRALARFVAAALIASAPWWIRSLVLVGNPVYPLFTSVFGDGGVPDVQVTAPLQHESAPGFDALGFLTFPWRIVMDPESFDGWQASPGGLVLALGVVGIVMGGRWTRWLGGFGLAGILAFYFVQRLARYIFPFFMPLYVTGGVAATELKPLERPIRWLLGFVFAFGLGIGAATMHFKLPAALGLESRDAYLTRRMERYPAFRWANAHLPVNAGVLTLDPRSYYLDRPTFQNLAMLGELVGMSAADQAVWMQGRGIRYIFVPEAYVSASPIFDAWGISPLVAAWREHEDVFPPVYVEDIPRPGGGEPERVEILEVVWGNGDAGP